MTTREVIYARVDASTLIACTGPYEASCCSKLSFQLGDWVYPKLQPYVQSSITASAHQKLSFRYFGAYQMVGRVGEVAYRLQLPASSRIHPVIHVSQLKLATGFKGTASSSLPDSLPDFSVPMQVLQTREVTKGNQPPSPASAGVMVRRPSTRAGLPAKIALLLTNVFHSLLIGVKQFLKSRGGRCGQPEHAGRGMVAAAAAQQARSPPQPTCRWTRVGGCNRVGVRVCVCCRVGKMGSR